MYLLASMLLLIVLSFVFSDKNDDDDGFSKQVKISLREVGNELLLSNQDSTSLVLPITKLEKTKYRLTFQDSLSFDPRTLVAATDSSLRRGNLPMNYRVEVIECGKQEVAYSYAMSVKKEVTLVPCGGRVLPQNCYAIEVKFVEKSKTTGGISPQQIFYALIAIVAVLFLLSFFVSKRILDPSAKETIGDFESIGIFKFYPEQNKLVKEAVEIGLSKKECELLALFVARPNQIIKRDELTKRVWEDNGVFVGRSLDTYISKLRKKLKEDKAIKLTNVHGVGYKLEIL